MKRIRNQMTVSLLALALVFPSISLAVGDSGAQVIKQVIVTNKKLVKLYGEDGNWLNPDVCSKANYLVLDPGTEASPNIYYPEMFALLISSYIQGKTVSATVEGCTTNRPSIKNVTSE